MVHKKHYNSKAIKTDFKMYKNLNRHFYKEDTQMANDHIRKF